MLLGEECSEKIKFSFYLSMAMKKSFITITLNFYNFVKYEEAV